MKRKNLDPNSPEVIDAVIEMIRKMTPEELYAFITYRTPGVPETNMVGMFSEPADQPKQHEEREPVPA